MKYHKHVGSVVRKLRGNGNPFRFVFAEGEYFARYLESGNVFLVSTDEAERGFSSGEWVVVDTPKVINGSITHVEVGKMLVEGDDGVEYTINVKERQALYIVHDDWSGDVAVDLTKEQAEGEVQYRLDGGVPRECISVYRAEQVQWTPATSVTIKE